MSQALARRVRRLANQLVARRRYRETLGKKEKAAVWTIRRGPLSGPRKQHRHGLGGEISENHRQQREAKAARKAAYDAGRQAAREAKREAKAARARAAR